MPLHQPFLVLVAVVKLQTKEIVRIGIGEKRGLCVRFEGMLTLACFSVAGRWALVVVVVVFLVQCRR